MGIARAIYKNADIILMDDPFSALDAHVKKKVFKNLVLEECKDKTRILVTHSVDFLQHADRILIMEKGVITN